MAKGKAGLINNLIYVGIPLAAPFAFFSFKLINFQNWYNCINSKQLLAV
jgi:hypothetical protein